MAGLGQHVIGIAQFKGVVNVCKVGTKCKNLTGCAASGLVQKCQQQASISLHGARDVNQDQKRQSLRFSLHAWQRQNIAILPCRHVHGFGPMNAIASAACACSSALNFRQWQLNLSG